MKFVTEETELLSRQGCLLTEQEAMGMKCCKRNSVWIERKKKKIGRGCPGMQWTLMHWKFSILFKEIAVATCAEDKVGPDNLQSTVSTFHESLHSLSSYVNILSAHSHHLPHA